MGVLTMSIKNKKAAGANQVAYCKNKIKCKHYINNTYNRPLYFPDPADFYFTYFGKIKKTGNNDFAVVNCCFHSPDKNPSLSINLKTGSFCCFSCGAKGHNIVKFCQLVYGIDYLMAKQLLNEWRC